MITTVVPTVSVSGVPTVTMLSFCYASEDFRDVSIILREAVGLVKSLNDSLLANRPKCGGVDLEVHQEIRRFRDEAGMAEFLDYLSSLIETVSAPKPTLTLNPDGGFFYKTASGLAGIGLQRSVDGNGWAVIGSAKFLYSEVVERNLRTKGFNVKSEQVDATEDMTRGGGGL